MKNGSLGGAAAPCAAIGLGDCVARAAGTVAPTGRYASTPSAGLKRRPATPGSRVSGVRCPDWGLIWQLATGYWALAFMGNFSQMKQSGWRAKRGVGRVQGRWWPF